MTTATAAAEYLAQHTAENDGKRYAVFNPHNRPIEELPIIYGFNNGGGRGFLNGRLIAQDGVPLGQHWCSAQEYMLHDLGVLEGSRPDRHEAFRNHYPDGYRMDFVGYEVSQHPGLEAAFSAHKARYPDWEIPQAAA